MNDNTLPEEDRNQLGMRQPDWDALAAGDAAASFSQMNGQKSQDPATEDEEDDNPFQESDEALPDDREERALDRDPSKEGSRFGEV